MLGLMLLAAATPASLDDRALRRAAAATFDKAAKMNTHERIGTYHGAAVVVDYPCSDLCPGYATRIIRLDVALGAACARAGGAAVDRNVPLGIGMTRKVFCVPRPIATP